ncbi:molybdopterin oxidoreductase family protein [Streptomyces jumonjinensis]|uniref:Molybdopterin oxidoreductase family protein n=1 Tax=Streptomyces jumonjinensis TaxID=1945 RepID=A0A646KRN1_STRJU|nr:molybdopterin oxidoreductase family protein [Streptomyces jumonjinensis]
MSARTPHVPRQGLVEGGNHRTPRNHEDADAVPPLRTSNGLVRSAGDGAADFTPTTPGAPLRTVHRTCPICDSVCGLKITLGDDGRVESVRGDQDDPLSKGYICPKGASLGRIDEDPDRLTVPMIRTGERWREVSWDEAFTAVERGLHGVVERHGRQALAAYFGNPTFHTMSGILYRGPLAQSLGTTNLFSASSIDQIPKHVAGGLMYGSGTAISVPDLDRTDFLLILGANPMVSHGSLCAAPDFPGRLRALRRRGGRIVVVDPRRTRTADVADDHLFIRPGTDAALLMAMVRTLFAEDLTAPRVPVEGLAELRAYAEPFTPEAVAPVCGVPAERIVQLTRELAAAPAAAVYTRMGTCTADFGTLTQWLVEALNVLTGNVDRPGGVMFPKPATMEVPWGPRPFTMGRWRSRVRGLPEALGELPLATLADEIETPGEGQVRALVTVAGNPVVSAPNGPRLGRALADLDFMVCVDPYLNETTRLADVILPPPRMLQMAHYDFLLLTVTVRNYTRFSPQALPLEPGQLSEGHIMARLSLIAAGQSADADPAQLDEMILGQLLSAGVQIPGSPAEGGDVETLRSQLSGESGPELILDAMLKLGPYGLSLDRLREHPNGLDLGPLMPRLAEVMSTESGRVRLAHPDLTPEVERLTARLAAPSAPTLLIGRRQLRSNNSWLHNVSALVGGSNVCTLQIHPDDVARHGLDAWATVRSAAGELVVPLEPTETIMPGVVSLPHGWGHAGSAQGVAARHPGVNANALTDETVTDAISGNAVFNGVPVTLAPADPPPSADAPPEQEHDGRRQSGDRRATVVGVDTASTPGSPAGRPPAVRARGAGVR